jgi:hypothetical protein
MTVSVIKVYYPILTLATNNLSDFWAFFEKKMFGYKKIYRYYNFWSEWPRPYSKNIEDDSKKDKTLRSFGNFSSFLVKDLVGHSDQKLIYLFDFSWSFISFSKNAQKSDNFFLAKHTDYPQKVQTKIYKKS